MPSSPAIRHLDSSPDRPSRPLASPVTRMEIDVEVEVAHLANPLVAVARLLSSEAEAHVHVTGDEQRFTISVALVDDRPETVRHAEAWVRWAVHNAGIRGRLSKQPALDPS